MLICLLACYLSWHLRQAWAPLTYADEHPATRNNPVAPATRSPSAQHKAAHKTTAAGQPANSFRDLIDPLATLTRDTITIGGQQIDKIITPTPCSGRPSPCSAPPSRSPWSRHQQNPPGTVNPLQDRGFTHLDRRKFGLAGVLEAGGYAVDGEEE